MEKNVKPRKGLSSLQIKRETLNLLKENGKKNEDYDSIIERLVSNQIEMDEGLRKELDKLTNNTGLEKKTLMSFGATLIIFLANSGALQELQKIAMSKKKPLVIVTLEMLKRFIKT